MPPLAREMVTYSTRWGREACNGPLRAHFFATLLGLAVDDWMQRTHEFSLPTGKSDETRRAIQYAREHIADVDLSAAAQAAFVSERTLSRRFSNELGMTWRVYVRHARLIRAMELLADGARVTETAMEVGYDSLSAFSAAFKELVGQSPQSYALGEDG